MLYPLSYGRTTPKGLGNPSLTMRQVKTRPQFVQPAVRGAALT